MKNPWQQVPLEVYESHMRLDTVAQLQFLNQVMKSQWQSFPQTTSAVVLGIAGGNGLEHCGDGVKTVIGIDVNDQYLQECKKRFGELLGCRFQLIQMDLIEPEVRLPKVDLVIANLLIEYVGIANFCAKVAESQAHHISCVIQMSGDPKQNFVSDSPYQSQLESIGALYQDVDERRLCINLARCGYTQILRKEYGLPNGKRFVRLDFRIRQEGEGFKKTHNYTK
ncbi:class I SAM-dependent methyltransferase [Acutalibacter caecimuris]|uniref:class I SAM-dependent methyltransferase n=1 Tax=Acutalibacter caecimuris TaxID=3093657 RepID=UPI002AC9E32F|nr:class I SAM-dependent methyltransferase [Acutalibacter sp. M00118]